MVFRFKQRQVADPLAQQNFEQLTGLIGQLQFSQVAAQETTSSQTYGNLATPGPSITIPSAGEWLVGWGATIEAASQNRGLASIDATDASAVQAAMGNPAAQSQGGSVAMMRSMTLAKGQVITMTYRNAIAATVSYEKRWIAALKIS